MAAIFNSNGSERLGREVNLYQGDGRRSKIGRRVEVVEWRLRPFPAPYPHRLLQLQIKHGRSDKRSRAYNVSSHYQIVALGYVSRTNPIIALEFLHQSQRLGIFLLWITGLCTKNDINQKSWANLITVMVCGFHGSLVDEGQDLSGYERYAFTFLN